MRRRPLIELIQECLNRGHSVEIVKCGPHAEPGKPYLACVTRSGFGSDDHLVYGSDANEILREAMTTVLAQGFQQPQDRYGLGLKRSNPGESDVRGAETGPEADLVQGVRRGAAPRGARHHRRARAG